MVTFSSTLLALSSAATILASPLNPLPQAKPTDLNTLSSLSDFCGKPSDPTLITQDLFTCFWTDGVGSVNFTNSSPNSYRVTWRDSGNFIAGKGWLTGSAAPVSYTGSWTSVQNSYLSLYGWMRNPAIEYYILESYGSFNPPADPAMVHKGSFVSDGGTYDVYLNVRVVNLPSGMTTVLQRWWSIRRMKRFGGTVTTRNHFDMWASVGMKAGTHEWQIMAVEGYYSSGQAQVTVQRA